MDGKILIVDDVATNRIVFKVKLGAACYNLSMASSGKECVVMARADRPDLILLDLSLPDIPGVEVLHLLRSDPLTRDIPVIVISSSGALEDRLLALEAGADDVFAKPYDDHLLMARVRNLLRARQDMADLTEGHDVVMFGMAEAAADFAPPGVLAVVTDRPDVALKLRRDLGPLIRDRIVVMGLPDALADVEPGRSGADIYLIDATDAPPERFLRLVSDLRSRVSTRHSGVCLMSPAPIQHDALMAFDLGANAILSSDMPIAEVALRLRAVLRRKRGADQRREQVQDGLRLAMIDPLTGLFNRRYASARLKVMAEQTRQQASGFAVMIVDIDRFKSVNDRFGHAAGDTVLQEISKRLAANLRSEDLLARIGGEEFLIALPETSLDDAQAVARRLCAQIECRPVVLPDDEALNITVSIGLALSDDLTDIERANGAALVGEVIDRADHALLASKKAGRNQVTLSRTAA